MIPSMPGASGMSTQDLVVTVKALQDSLAAVSKEQVRMQELNTDLEDRVQELERLIGAKPPPKDKIGVFSESPDATVKKDEGEEAGEETDIDTVEHSIGESLWEAPVIIGLSGMSPYNAGLLLVALLLNAIGQAYLCVVLITSNDFIKPDRFFDLEGPMRHWRTTHAHNWGEVDAAGVTLASRVCGDDSSLAVALSQGDLLSEINSYLGLQPEELEPQRLGTGPLLGTMCIFLFTGMVLKDVRSLVTSVLAVCAVPRGTTRLENGCLVALSPGRFAIFLAASIARAVVAIMLLYTGVFWLAATTSITDLILNAVALGFVTDFPEILWETLVPTVVHTFVQNLEPVRYRRLRGSLEAVVPLVALIFIVILSSTLLIGRNMQQMVVVKEQLCGGNLEFATIRNPANFIVSMRTRPLNDEADPNVEQRAVQELIDHPQLGEGFLDFSFWAALPSLAQQYSTRTLAEAAQSAPCADQDWVASCRAPALKAGWLPPGVPGTAA